MPRDAERMTFGVRDLKWDADKGFFLNGKPVKIKGTCNHQDHAGVGAALPDRLQAFRLAVLKDMGGNAVRTSHNMPTPEWVEACDRMGMMMMCETRLMSANPEGMAQLETMIKRYRNSPSIILWSMGNEEWTMMFQPQGVRVVDDMIKRTHELDPTRMCTAAVNTAFDTHFPEQLDVMGFNYNLKVHDAWHKNHPNIPSRGVGDGQHGFDARYLFDGQAAQLGQRLRSESHCLVAARRGVVEVLRHARMALRRLCMDRASITAGSRRRTDGLRSIRNSASSTCAAFPKTTSITTKHGGDRSRCCTCFPIGIGSSVKASRSPCGCIPTWIRWKSF